MNYKLDNPIAKRKTKTVYKLFVENYSKGDILNEALNQARVEEGTDLCIPKLLEVCKIDNRWAIVSEHIEGTTIAELMEQNPGKIDEYLNRFVDIQLSILSKSVPLLNTIKEKYKRKIDELESLTDNQRYELQQRLDGMKKHTKLCHGDYNPSNVIIKPDGKAAIIDWAHVTIGNASSDAANTYMYFKMEGKDELAEKYLDLFTQKSGIDRTLIQKWLPIVAASRKLKAVPEEQEILDTWIDIKDYE